MTQTNTPTNNPYIGWTLANLTVRLAKETAWYNDMHKSNKLSASGKSIRRDIKQIKEAIQLKSK